MPHAKRPATRAVVKTSPPAPQPVRSVALENALAAVSDLCATAGTLAGIDLDVYLESIDAGMSEAEALALARQEPDAPPAAGTARPATAS